VGFGGGVELCHDAALGYAMKIRSLTGALIALAFLMDSARAADDAMITRLATCQDSWLDWKNDPVQTKKFIDHFQSEFSPHDNDPYFLPKTNVSVLGLHIAQAFPQSVGMGLGFSLTVDAPFDKARKVFEKVIGKPLQQCETGEGMRTCGLQIAEKRTVTVMAEDIPKSTQTLVGCYYYYEK
jgi:hypothetical protein